PLEWAQGDSCPIALALSHRECRHVVPLRDVPASASARSQLLPVGPVSRRHIDVYRLELGASRIADLVAIAVLNEDERSAAQGVALAIDDRNAAASED